MISILVPVKDGLETFIACLTSISFQTFAIKSIYILDSSDTPLISVSPLVGELLSVLGKTVDVNYMVKKLPLVKARTYLLRNFVLNKSGSNVYAFMDSDICFTPNTNILKAVSKYFYNKNPQDEEYGFIASTVISPTNIAGYSNYINENSKPQTGWYSQFYPGAMETRSNIAGLFFLMFNKVDITEEFLYFFEKAKVREDMLFTRYLSLRHKKGGIIDSADMQVLHLGKTRMNLWNTEAFNRDVNVFDKLVDKHNIEHISELF